MKKFHTDAEAQDIFFYEKNASVFAYNSLDNVNIRVWDIRS